MDRYQVASFRFWVLTVFVAVFLVGCGGQFPVEGDELVDFGIGDGDLKALATPTAEATFTPSPVPTVTVDYAATLVIAQQTADEARRLNTQATAEYEKRVQEQIRLTAEQDARVFEAYGWTATAALTAIPATQTQQVIVNTQIAAQQTLESARITQTNEAPAKLIEMQNAEEYVQYAPVRVGGDAFMKLAVGVAFLFLAAWLRTQPQWSKAARDKLFEDYMNDKEQSQAEVKKEAGTSSRETVVVMKNDNGQGHFSQRRLVIPCSADQLTELANGLISGKSLGINQWEGSGTSLTRDVITGLRHFFLSNRLATSIGGGRVAVNDDGLAFCRGWVEQGLLPTSFQFMSNGNGNHGNMAHEHEKSYDSHGVGEAVTNE